MRKLLVALAFLAVSTALLLTACELGDPLGPARPTATSAPVAAATATPQLAVGGATAQPTAVPADAARQAAEAQLVGRPGAKFVVDGSPQLTLPIQPGNNCDQIKVGVGNSRSYRVAVEEGISIVIDAVTVNGMFDGSNPGVAWKKGPWSGTLDILDGAICAVPSEWHDWAVKHRTDVLSGIRTRYGLSPTPPVRELS